MLYRGRSTSSKGTLCHWFRYTCSSSGFSWNDGFDNDKGRKAALFSLARPLVSSDWMLATGSTKGVRHIFHLRMGRLTEINSDQLKRHRCPSDKRQDLPERPLRVLVRLARLLLDRLPVRGEQEQERPHEQAADGTVQEPQVRLRRLPPAAPRPGAQIIDPPVLELLEAAAAEGRGRVVQPAEAVEGEEDVARRRHGREDAAHLVRVALGQPDVLADHRVLAPEVLEVGAVDVAVEALDCQGEDDDQKP